MPFNRKKNAKLRIHSRNYYNFAVNTKHTNIFKFRKRPTCEVVRL